jgi:hypothetical protein
MQIKKLLLLVILSLSTFAINAQTNFTFPLSGSFSVKQIEGQPINKYNKLIIEGNNFQILKDDLVLKYFRITEFTGNGYQVEQYFPENDDQKKDRERFIIKIISTNETESYISVEKPLRTELINIIKL